MNSNNKNAEDVQQNMQFGIEEDYEGGMFINGEFYALNEKRKRAQTKDEALYGMFASDSDEEESYKSRKRKEKADYQKPLSFVSRGVVNDINNDSAVLQPPKQPAPPQNQESSGEQEEEYQEDYFGNSSFQKNLYRNAVQRKKSKDDEKQKEKQRQKNLTQTGGSGGGLQSWDRGGKIAGMMAKMGWKPGSGLGRDQQGIAKPVEARLRPRNMGIGFGSFQEPTQQDDFITVRKEHQAEQKLQSTRKNWVKGLKQQEKTSEYVYKSARQMLEEKGANNYVGTTVIDMRGPHAKVLQNLEDISDSVNLAASQDLPFPELQHNVRLLVDMVEVEIIQLTSKTESSQDRLLVEGRELQRLELKEQQTTDTLNRMTEMNTEVERIWSQKDYSSLEDLRIVLENVQHRFPEEYVMYDIRTLSLGVILPKFRKAFSAFNPLQQEETSDELITELLNWRNLLEEENQAGSQASLFSKLVREVLLPQMRRALVQWEPRNPESLLQFLEKWNSDNTTPAEKLFPADILEQILNMQILPRLKQAVNSWNPTQERVAIHQWVHPWLPYLGTQLDEVYPTIRHRLANALRTWHPADSSAFLILHPWKRVFKSAEWDMLMLNCILPKLAESLDSLLFSVQVLPQLAMPLPPPLQQTLRWIDVLAVEHIIVLFEAHFFQRWHECLHAWLMSQQTAPIGQPTEVQIQGRRWYSGWKELITVKIPQIADHQQIKAHFDAAFEALNLSELGELLQNNYPCVAPLVMAVPPLQQQQQQQQQSMPQVVNTMQSQISLREMVEHYAGVHNLEFVPKVGRTHEGMQVYGFGRVSVVVNELRQIILAQVGDVWMPMHLDSLMSEHRSRLGSS